MEAINIINHRLSRFDASTLNFSHPTQYLKDQKSTEESPTLKRSSKHNFTFSNVQGGQKSLKKQCTRSFTSSYVETEETKTESYSFRYQNIAKYKKFIKITDTINAILGIFGLSLAVIEYEIFYDDSDKERYSSNPVCNGLRLIISISTACVIFLLSVHAYLSYNLHKIEKENEFHPNFFFSKYFRFFLIESFVMGIHCPAGLDQTYNIRQLGSETVYSLDGILMVWMLMRVYLVIRLFAQYSKWTNEMADECCERENCEANTIFAMKSVLKEKPFSCLLVLFVGSCVIFGLAVRHFERPVYYGKGVNDSGFQDYSYIWNGIWLIAITMMTVGYGDFFPKTHMGRVVCILACFWGIFIVSMMVVTLTVVSSFDEKEKKAYDILYRLSIKETLKKKGAFVLTQSIRITTLQKKFLKGKVNKNEYQKERIKLFSKLEMRLQYFRDVRNSISEYEITSEESLKQLTEKIDRDLDEVKEMLLSMIEIEKQLTELEHSHNMVIKALNECSNFTNQLEQQINSFKIQIVEKIEKYLNEHMEGPKKVIPIAELPNMPINFGNTFSLIDYEPSFEKNH